MKYVPVNFIVDSSASFLRNISFDSSVYLRGVTHINMSALAASTDDTPYALITEGTGAEQTLVRRQLGTIAWESSANYVQITYVDSQDQAFDASMSSYVNAQDQAFDSSMSTYVTAQDAVWDASMSTYVDAYNTIQDASIAALESATTEAWNGLTTTDLSVGLGGTLNVATTIAAGSNDFQITGQNGAVLSINGTFDTRWDNYDGTGNFTTLLMSGIGQPYLRGGNANRYSEVAPGRFGTTITYDASDYTVSVALDTSGGLRYGGDYSAAFGDRHLIDKGFLVSYVDGSLGTLAVNAWNGLTTTDLSVGLGGTLNVATTITTTASETLTIAGLQNNPGELSAVVIAAGGELGRAELGTMAYNSAAAWDASLVAIKDTNTAQDASIVANRNVNTSQDASIVRIDASVSDQETRITTNETDIANLDSSLDLYLPLTGGQLTGELTTLGAGIQVGTVGNQSDVSIYGGLYVHNGMVVGGDLTIDGSLFIRDVETIDVSGAFISMNSGLSGTPPASMQSGIIVQRGAEDPYVFIYDESQQTFRIGIAAPQAGPSFNDASTQAVATREDTPDTGGVGYWNQTQNRIDTDSAFTYTPATGLALSSGLDLTGLSASDGTYALTVGVAGGGDVYTRQLSVIDVQNKLVSGYEVLAETTDEVAYLRRITAGSGCTITQDSSTIEISVAGSAGYVSKYTGTFDVSTNTQYVIPNSGGHNLGNGPFTVSVYEGTQEVGIDVYNAANGDITLQWGSGALSGTCKYIISG